MGVSREGLRPEIRAFLEAQDLLDEPPVWEVSVAEARAGMVASSRERWGPIDQVDSIVELAAPGRAGDVPLRVYRSAGGGSQPVFVYIHGGGWLVGDLDSHDGLCRALVHACGCTVVAVDYRRAPEHPFPAPVEDSLDAVRWVLAEGASTLGVDRDRAIVGGDSAGGNLSAVVARHLAHEGVALAGQVLLYPACDTDTTYPSYDDFADGFDLTTPAVRWFYGQYLADGPRALDPDRAPMHADDLAAVAPAYVATAAFDPVRDDGRAYAAKLRAAGVDVVFDEFSGTVHGFALMRSITPATDEMIGRVATFTRARWGG